MASDTLNQAGKALGKTKKDSDFTIRRAHELFPMLEHVRDSFDDINPFYMEFKTDISDNNVKISIQIKEPFLPC